MTEIKWIKLSTSVFDNRKIKWIESIPDGDTIIVIWFKLLCLAGSTNSGGDIYFTTDVPYTDEMLAAVFNKSVQTVKTAMSIFQQFGMIEIVENIIHISNWEKYQNVDGMERIREQTKERVQRYRERQKHECNATCNVTVTQGNEADIDKEKEKEIVYTDSNESVCRTEDVQQIKDAWNALGIGAITTITAETTRGKMLKARISQNGVEKVLEAIERIRKSSYLQGQSKYGWVITFDWFVKPNNFLKVLEGQYDDHIFEQTAAKKYTKTEDSL